MPRDHIAICLFVIWVTQVQHRHNCSLHRYARKGQRLHLFWITLNVNRQTKRSFIVHSPQICITFSPAVRLNKARKFLLQIYGLCMMSNLFEFDAIYKFIQAYWKSSKNIMRMSTDSIDLENRIRVNWIKTWKFTNIFVMPFACMLS